MPETCEKWLGLVNNWVYHAHQTGEICQVLSYSLDFKAPSELWNPLNNTVFSKYYSFCNKVPVNIRNDRKAKK